MLDPVADGSTYALAMVTVGVGMMICWAIALRVVDRRRSFLVVVMLAIYPIFNLKGFKYNADLLQLITLPLLMLAYLDAFDKRTIRSGIWLGLAGALALMTKYWVLTMIGAIGLAALIHPARMLFLRPPAHRVAIAAIALHCVRCRWWSAAVRWRGGRAGGCCCSAIRAPSSHNHGRAMPIQMCGCTRHGISGSFKASSPSVR